MIDLRFNSLQSRIFIFHLIAMVVAAIVVPLTNYLVINRSANQFEAQSLRTHAMTIGRYLRQDAQGVWHLDLPGDLRTLYVHELDGLSYQVVDNRTSLVIRQFPDEAALRRRAYFRALDAAQSERTRPRITDRTA